MLTKAEDPFYDLGPLRYFNAQKRWSKPYSVQLVRDDKVVYGFSIQGRRELHVGNATVSELLSKTLRDTSLEVAYDQNISVFPAYDRPRRSM